MKDILTIDRAKWRTATSGKGDTRLLNEEGFMCCLGFRCFQMGIPEKDLLNKLSPGQLAENWDIPDLINHEFGGIYLNSDFSNDAILLNDSSSITSEEREKKIKEHFNTYRSTHTTYHDNRHCRLERVAFLEQLSQIDPYQVYTLGKWGNRKTDDPFFYTFDKAKHVVDIVETNLNSDFSQKAILLNDSSSITSEERERQIKKHFKTKDIQVVFTGEYKIIL